jgi:flagellar hook-length control protein FliK
MIIDSSNLLSAASQAEGLDTLQPAVSSENGLSSDFLAFSETLTQKINQLQGLDISHYATDGLSAETLDSGNLLPQVAGLISGAESEQQDIAGLMGGNEMATGIAGFFANGLAESSKLETDIDLENTLETLANVLNSIEEQKDEIGEDLLALGAPIAVEVENIEKKMPKEISMQLGQQQQDVEMSVDGVDEFIAEADMENNLGMVSVAASNFQAVEKDAVPVNQDLKTGLNKESISLSQITEERISAGVSAKSEAEVLQQKNNLLSETGQKGIDPMLTAKQNKKVDILEAKINALDLSAEKAVPKFAADMANLNRAVIPENKTEIPPMTKHFAHPEWNKEVGERVIWMHKQAIPSAELRLNPAHLGPVTIKIETNQDQVSVAFTAQHAAVKEAIDAALPKLREMLNAQQLNLSEVSVSQEDARQKQQPGFSQMGSDADKDEKQANEMAENGQTENTMDIADEIEAGRAIASNGVLSIFA